MNNILVTVCARGGSKGIPGKNIKSVGGKPLLYYTAKKALEYAGLANADIVLSTDSDAILEVGRECGLPTEYKRPDYLANDTCGKPDAIKDALLWAENRYGKRYGLVVDLDVTSPIRTMEDILGCVALMEGDSVALTVFSVSPASRNPYFSMVMQKGNGYFAEVLDGYKFTTRQSSPPVYDMNGSIYVYRRDSLMPEHPRAVTPRSLVYVMDHICFDLDEPSDYDYLAYLVETGKVSI